MPYLLRFDGANDYVSGDAAASVATASSFSVEIDVSIPVIQGDTKIYRLGVPSVFILIGPQLDATCRLFIFNGGAVTQVYTAPLISNTRYLIRVDLDFSAMTYVYKLDGAVVSSGAISGGAITGINRFRTIGAQDGGSGFCQMDLYGLKEFVNGTQISFYDPSGTSSGTTLFDTVGSNDGTLNNFTVPACWVFYGSASNAVSVSATLPKITGSLTLNEINPSYAISVSGQLPKLTGAVTLNDINPVFTVAVAGQLPKLTGSITLNQFANNRQVTVNGVLPKLTGAVTLNRIQPNNQAAVSGQLPRITASITLRVPDSYPTANPNDYTVSAYLSTDTTINAIIRTETTYAARLN